MFLVFNNNNKDNLNIKYFQFYVFFQEKFQQKLKKKNQNEFEYSKYLHINNNMIVK